jgi:5'-deoxynucleotidase YfbR-like HD superfamily hydrolase
MVYKKISPKQIVDFMIIAGKLKWTKRSGWLEKGMPEPETVAEHTYRTTLLSAILASKLQLNPKKLTAMAIFHDLAEGTLGDPIIEKGIIVIKPHNISEEIIFMKNLFNNLGMPFLFKYWYENILENGPKKTKY